MADIPSGRKEHSNDKYSKDDDDDAEDETGDDDVEDEDDVREVGCSGVLLPSSTSTAGGGSGAVSTFDDAPIRNKSKRSLGISSTPNSSNRLPSHLGHVSVSFVNNCCMVN